MSRGVPDQQSVNSCVNQVKRSDPTTNTTQNRTVPSSDDLFAETKKGKLCPNQDERSDPIKKSIERISTTRCVSDCTLYFKFNLARRFHRSDLGVHRVYTDPRDV